MRGARGIVLAALVAACASVRSGSEGPYAPADGARRDTVRAQALNREAAALLHDDPERAEKILREALTADLFFGPAHNNLGVLFLGRGELYEAANEFEWARKLLPGHPDPRLNLGITLERAGQADAAIQAYETALEVHPGHVPTLQALVRMQLRRGEPLDELLEALETIALSGETEAWRGWARGRLLRGRER